MSADRQVPQSNQPHDADAASSTLGSGSFAVVGSDAGSSTQGFVVAGDTFSSVSRADAYDSNSVITYNSTESASDHPSRGISGRFAGWQPQAQQPKAQHSGDRRVKYIK